jgi:hypothetical protein
VPRDTSTVPIATIPAARSGDSETLPLALACSVNGRDCRSCPTCGRVFEMHANLAGKAIRCRGCESSFRIGSSEPVGLAKTPAVHASASPCSSPAAAAPVPSVMTQREDSASNATDDDIGDVLAAPQGDECVPSVVRPRRVAARSRSGGVLATLVSVVLGGVCALPISQLILWWGVRQDPLNTVKMLPPALRWIAPDLPSR